MLLTDHSATSLLLNRFASSATSQESWINELFSSNLKTRQQAEHILRLYANYRLPPEISTPDVVHLSGLLGLVTLTNSDEDGITKTIQSAYHVALRRRAHGNNDAWQALHDLSQRLEHEAAVSRRLGYSGARNGAGTAFIAAPWLEEWQIVYWVQAQQQILNVRDPEDIDLDLARETFWQRCEQADPNRIVSGRLVDLAEILDPDLRETENESSFTHELVDTGRPSLWGRVPRFNEESPEEAEVRRRRRDVMVLHEGGGPIGREDIIQPPSMLTDRYGRSLDGRAWTR